MTLIDVAQRAGMSLDEIRVLLEHGNDEFSTELAGLAARLDALIERAQRVREWMAQAAECRCEAIDSCALFSASGAAR